MLLIIAPEEKYINNLVNKFDYTKKSSINKMNIYNCNYNNQQFLIAATGYGKVNIIDTRWEIPENRDCGLIAWFVKNKFV